MTNFKNALFLIAILFLCSNALKIKKQDDTSSDTVAATTDETVDTTTTTSDSVDTTSSDSVEATTSDADDTTSSESESYDTSSMTEVSTSNMHSIASSLYDKHAQEDDTLTLEGFTSTIQEFYGYFGLALPTEEEATNIFDQIDTEAKGYITREEFENDFDTEEAAVESASFLQKSH